MPSHKQNKAELQDEIISLQEQMAQLESELAAQKRQHTQQERLLQAEQDYRRVSEMLLEISVDLHQHFDFHDILAKILDYVDQIVSYDAACILQPHDDIVLVQYWKGYTEFEKDDVELIFQLDDIPFFAEGASSRISPILLATVDEEHSWTRNLGEPWIKSHISLPIILGNEFVGLLQIDSATPNRFTQVDLGWLDMFNQQLTLALQNARLYGQTRQEVIDRDYSLTLERNFMLAVLDTVGALVMVLDKEGRIQRFNRACEETTGYVFDEVKDEPFWDLFLPADGYKRVKTIFETLIEENAPNQYRSYWLTKDNQKLLIDWATMPLRNVNDEVEFIISTGIDITESQQLEERLVAIHQLSRELNLLRDEAAIWEIALETAAFLLDFKSAGYGVVGDLVGELDYLYQPVRGVPTMIQLHLPIDTEDRVRVLKTHSERTTNTFEGGSSIVSASRQSHHIWLAAPMKVGERLIGMLDIESHDGHKFSANDQRLFQTLADQTAVAIENARLHLEARQRVDELTSMNMISQAIASTLDLAATLTIITDHAIRLLEAMAASVVLNDQVQGDLWFNAASGGKSEFVRGQRLPAGQGIVGWVVEHGESVLVPDVTKDPRFYSKFDRQTGFITESVICSPLRTGDQTIGAIEVLNKKHGVFTQEDLQLLAWLATPAATAIENARLFEAERTARRQAELLREATATLTSTLDLKQVLNSILVYLEGVISFDTASVFLSRDDMLEVVAERGLPHAVEPTHRQRYTIDNPLYQEITDTAQPVIIANARQDPRFKTWNSNENIRGWMGVPLMAQRLVIGCLTLDSHQEDAYGANESSLAQAFANQATVAIQNAQLFEEVRTGRERLQSLSHQLVEVQEMERRHIARELHDEAGQSLSSLMVGLRLLQREVEDPQKMLEGILNLKQMTNEVSENLHRLAINLRPASLDQLGVKAALRQHIETFGRQNNMTTQFEVINLNDDRLLPTVETNLYRIVQEALTNVARHAQATHIDVLLERRGEQLLAIIEDNGVGFDTEVAGQTSRLGLLGMRERAEMMNGNLVIESTNGVGTTIYVEVPYVHSNSDS